MECSHLLFYFCKRFVHSFRIYIASVPFYFLNHYLKYIPLKLDKRYKYALYTLNDKYEYNIKCSLYKQYLVRSGLNGVIDSIRGLLFHNNNNNNNNKSKYSHVNIVNELLKSF